MLGGNTHVPQASTVGGKTRHNLCTTPKSTSRERFFMLPATSLSPEEWVMAPGGGECRQDAGKRSPVKRMFSGASLKREQISRA